MTFRSLLLWFVARVVWVHNALTQLFSGQTALEARAQSLENRVTVLEGTPGAPGLGWDSQIPAEVEAAVLAAPPIDV